MLTNYPESYSEEWQELQELFADEDYQEWLIEQDQEHWELFEQEEWELFELELVPA